MRECPKCGTVYTDVTLSYCLSDGTPLIAQIDGDKTEVLPDFVVETKDSFENETRHTNLPTVETVVRTDQDSNKKGVSPLWIFATFGLFGILLISIFSVWFFSDKIFSEKDIARQNETISNSNVKENNSETPNENLSPEIKSTETKETPRPSEKPIQKPTVKPEPEKTSTPKGDFYRVVGVKNNDVLYIRPQAGNLKVVVGKIPPNGSGIKILGGKRRVGKSIWVLINYRGKTGWVNSRFIAKER